MKCSFRRQCTENGKIQFLSSPDDYKTKADVPYYKDIINMVPTENEEKKFYIFSLGHEYSDPEKKLMNRVYRNGFIVHYVVAGKGTYNDVPIGRGSSFICWPGIAHSLVTDPDDRLEFYWVFLRGSELLNNLLRFGFNSASLFLNYSWEDEIIRIFNDALYTPHPDADLGEYYAGILSILMSFHKKANIVMSINSMSMQEQYIISANNLMSESHYDISVETLARRIGISRKYFSLLFKKSTGVTPQEYMARNRIELSKSMLKSAKYRVCDVADMLGYSDYTAFSRAFVKYTGISPTEYAGTRKKSNDTQD